MQASTQSTINAMFGLSPQSVFQVYGHAEPSGDEASNKSLSERRARAMLACLTGEFRVLQEVAESEGWGLHEHQVMLRTLKCDPGAIDGVPGDVTERAVALFQYEYLHRFFHRHLSDTEPLETFEIDGVLGASTVRALIEAYVLCVSPRLPPARVHPTHPAVGCSEFNRIDLHRDPFNRRVSLVVHPELPVHHDAAPCTDGDHEVCPVDDREPRARCLWYREHVLDPELPAIEHRHFDLRWLPLPNRKILLSALTTLPDGESIEFQPFKSMPVRSANELSADALAEPLAESMEGLIRGSVAQVVWELPPDYAAVLTGDVEHEDMGGEPQSAAAHFEDTRAVKLPVFVCRGGGVSAISPPPGRELVRQPSKASFDADDEASGFASVDWFGNIYQQSSHPEGRADGHAHPLRDGEPMTWHVRHMERPHEPSENR